MAHYDVTHTCGHRTRVNLTGPHRSREWRLAQMAQEVCRECWKAAQLAAATARRDVERWPAWTAGSSAQQTWAESLRGTLLDQLATGYAAYLEQMTDERDREKLTTLYTAGRARLIAEFTDARWWIEHRDDSSDRLLREVVQLGIAVHPDLDPRPPAAAPAAAPVTPLAPAPTPPALPLLRPESPRSNTIATITYDAPTRKLIVRFPEYHEAFRQTMRNLDYTWSGGAWERLPLDHAGDSRDLLAEVAHRLVAAGFVVQLFDAEAHARAVAGTFQPERRRWVRAITKGEYQGWLTLFWPRSDDLYAAANSLRGARWRNGHMLVPPGSADEIEEFARTYDFAISDAARKVLDEVHDSLAHGVVLSAPQAKPRRRTAGDGDVPASVVPPVLPVPENVEIADALRDDD